MFLSVWRIKKKTEIKCLYQPVSWTVLAKLKVKFPNVNLANDAVVWYHSMLELTETSTCMNPTTNLLWALTWLGCKSLSQPPLGSHSFVLMGTAFLQKLQGSIFKSAGGQKDSLMIPRVFQSSVLLMCRVCERCVSEREELGVMSWSLTCWLLPGLALHSLHSPSIFKCRAWKLQSSKWN